MLPSDYFQLVLFLTILALTAKPLGIYMDRVFEGARTFLSPALGPVERMLYKFIDVDPDEDQHWTKYSVHLLMFSAVSFLFTYIILRLQQYLPLNPAAMGEMSPHLSFNTAMSFTTNTNWQSYGGESTMSYLSQMVALTLHNFLSAAVGIAVAVALVRALAKKEHGLLKQIADLGPDAVLVRNLAAVSFFREIGIPMFGDYALNVANELTAALFAEAGLERVTASYDLNWRQLEAMVRNSRPAFFEVVVHQHMPMFHMEHCVFAHTLSSGKDARDCGRPCERHVVDLRGDDGQPHPLIADVGCRNTVFNAAAQSAAEFLPRMQELGLVHFRIELLRETPAEAKTLLDRYSRVLAGHDDPRSTWRKLMVLNQLGVTRGTLEHV